MTKVRGDRVVQKQLLRNLTLRFPKDRKLQCGGKKAKTQETFILIKEIFTVVAQIICFFLLENTEKILILPGAEKHHLTYQVKFDLKIPGNMFEKYKETKEKV